MLQGIGAVVGMASILPAWAAVYKLPAAIQRSIPNFAAPYFQDYVEEMKGELGSDFVSGKDAVARNIRNFLLEERKLVDQIIKKVSTELGDEDARQKVIQTNELKKIDRHVREASNRATSVSEQDIAEYATGFLEVYLRRISDAGQISRKEALETILPTRADKDLLELATFVRDTIGIYFSSTIDATYDPMVKKAVTELVNKIDQDQY